ncbi:MAG: ABC transporter substrate-binding protein [Enterococcus sp.]
MKMNKKAILTGTLALSTVAIISGCGTSDESKHASANEKEEVTILTAVTGGKTDEEMKAFEKELSKLSGYDVHMVKPDDYNAVLMQKLKAGGEDLDLIYLGQDQLADLVDQGALLDLTDKIADSKVLSDTSVIPQSEWDNIAIDDKLYAGFNKKEIERVVNVNEPLLTNHDISPEVEESLQGYYQLFKELKAKDTDQGFYPFNLVLSELYDLQPWFASAGLKGGIVIDEDGKKTVPWSSDESVAVWEWFQKLYAEELMDPSALTDTTKELRSKFQAGQTGVVVDWAAWTGLYNVNAEASYPEQFAAVPHGGTKNADGDYMLTRGGASLFGVPASSDNVDGAMKILEVFATQEGGDLLSLGVEGLDYNVTDGKYELTETGEANGMDHGAPFPVSEKYEAPFPHNPGVDEALDLLEFASIETYSPEATSYKEIVAKYALKMVKEQTDVKQTLKEMRTELKNAGVID